MTHPSHGDHQRGVGEVDEAAAELGFGPPELSDLDDHDVPGWGEQLRGRRVALVVTGGIAALKAPLVARTLRRLGAEVVAFASTQALRYTTVEALQWSTTNPVVTALSPAAEHLGGRGGFDAYLVAPATYNAINKVAGGVADDVVTTVLGAALGRMQRGLTQVLVAPAMHGTMHNTILIQSLLRLHRMGVQVIPPRQQNGKNNLPDEKTLAAEVSRAASRSALAGVPILVTSGTTPVPIDHVRRITNRFRGRLGIAIAEDLFLRGAQVMLIHGDGAYRPPGYLPHLVARTYSDYRAAIAAHLSTHPCTTAVLSAGVADYQPATVVKGKIPSGTAFTLPLVPTAKVIDDIARDHPHTDIVAFKYQENIDHAELMRIASQRLSTGGYLAVVANRGEETGPAGEQIAYLCTRTAAPHRLVGKTAIARGITSHLETQATPHSDP